MTNRSTGPACGNNPNHRMTPGDRQAVADFRAYLAARAALRDRIAAALTAEHYRRAEARTVASPEEHCAAMADAVLAVLPEPTDRAASDLEIARTTNQRLNREKQRLESELAAYRRAVSQWEISERGTYIPHASLRAIGLASGKDILGSVRHLKHFERVEQAEAEVERLRAGRAASLQEAAALLHQRASSIDALSSSDFGEEARAVGELAEAAETLRRMADETATTETHACDNCEGVDPDTCINNPNRPPEQCPRSEGDGYGLQCQKPAGHNLCTFEEQPAAGARQDGATQ